MSRKVTDESLRDEMHQYKRERDAAVAALKNANEMLLAVFLREQMVDPSDFEAFADMADILNKQGEINWASVDRAIRELLRMKPHLATPGDDMPWRRGQSAVDWFLKGA